MSDESTFTVTVDGKSVSIPLARARTVCPAEVRVMEAAGARVSQAAQASESSASTTATLQLQEAMEALFHALVEKVRRGKLDRTELSR